MEQAVEMYWERVYSITEIYDEIYNDFRDEDRDYEIGDMTTDELESSHSTRETNNDERSDATDVFHGGVERQAENAGILRDMHIWSSGEAFDEQNVIPNYHQIIESAVRDIKQIVEHNAEENVNEEEYYFRKIIEATHIFINDDGIPEFVDQIQEMLKSIGINTRRSFIRKFLELNNLLHMLHEEMLSQMLRHVMMMHVISHIDKRKTPDLYMILLESGRRMGKRNMVRWTNRLHEKLETVNVKTAERLMYSIMYVNGMLRERNDESIDYHVMTTMMHAISEIVTFGNEPQIKPKNNVDSEIVAGVDIEETHYGVVISPENWFSIV
jgi:hypothetical protein